MWRPEADGGFMQKFVNEIRSNPYCVPTDRRLKLEIYQLTVRTVVVGTVAVASR